MIKDFFIELFQIIVVAIFMIACLSGLFISYFCIKDDERKEGDNDGRN